MASVHLVYNYKVVWYHQCCEGFSGSCDHLKTAPFCVRFWSGVAIDVSGNEASQKLENVFIGCG